LGKEKPPYAGTDDDNVWHGVVSEQNAVFFLGSLVFPYRASVHIFYYEEIFVVDGVSQASQSGSANATIQPA